MLTYSFRVNAIVYYPFQFGLREHILIPIMPMVITFDKSLLCLMNLGTRRS